jgi:hypothetical protein
MLHPLVQENYYLQRRVQELEREIQHIRLMLAAKTLMIGKLEVKLENIQIETLSGTLTVGVTHSAETDESKDGCVHLPHLPKRPIMEI